METNVYEIGKIGKLINDHFQNFKSYGIPHAQLIIADVPYNLDNKAYASNPMWYVGGDNKNGESELAGKAFFDTDKDTALIYINEKSELSSALPDKFTEHVAECSNLCDATGQFRYYKNLFKVYQVVRRSLSLVNDELAKVTGDKESLKGANKELKSQVKRLREANSELACQLERLKRYEKKTFWDRIFGK